MDEFGRVLADAGEPAPGPRPAGWAGDALLSRMHEQVAAYEAARSARWAGHGPQRQAARALYEETRRRAGLPVGALPPWLADEPPMMRIW